jgi:MFS family permease
MDNKTEMGLLLLIFGMILGIISTLGSAATGDFGGASVSSGSIISAVVGIFSFILLLVGWILLVVGRKEFGEEHSKLVIYSMVVLIVGMIIVIIGTIISTMAGISDSMETTNGELTIDYVEMARGMKSAVVISQIGGIVVTIAAILLVYHLENDLGKKVLYLALIASIAVAIVSMIYMPGELDDLAEELKGLPEEDREEGFYEGLSDLGVYQSLGLISSILLTIGYYIPYNRIKKGELKPVMPPTPPYGAAPYPAQYPYQPYPPYQPGQDQQPPYQQPPYQQPYPSQYPPRQPPVTPKEGETPPSEPSPDEPVQPKEVPMETAEIISCRFCNTQIPKGSTICPVCQKEL